MREFNNSSLGDLGHVVIFCDFKGYTFNILPGSPGVGRRAWALGLTPSIRISAQLYQPCNPSVQ